MLRFRFKDSSEFHKEMSQRNQTVNEAVKTVTENKVDMEPRGRRNGLQLRGGKQGLAKRSPRSILKGQVLDARAIST